MQVVENEVEVAESPKLDLTKFPHLEIVGKSIESLERLIELMDQKRIILDGRKSAGNVKNEDAIDAEIALINLDNRKSKLHTQLIQKKQYYKEFYEKCQSTLEEMASEYDSVIERATRRAGVSKELNEYMKNADTTVFESNLEEKMKYYLDLRKTLEPKNKLKKVK